MRDKRITKQQRQAIKTARRESGLSGVRLINSTGKTYRPAEVDHNLRRAYAETRLSVPPSDY